MLKEKKTHGPDETRLGVRGKVTVIIQTADECRRGTRRAAAYFFLFLTLAVSSRSRARVGTNRFRLSSIGRTLLWTGFKVTFELRPCIPAILGDRNVFFFSFSRLFSPVKIRTLNALRNYSDRHFGGFSPRGKKQSNFHHFRSSTAVSSTSSTIKILKYFIIL